MNEQLENNNNDDEIDNNFEEIDIKNNIEIEDDDIGKLRGRNNNNSNNMKNRGSKRIFLDDFKDRKTKNMIREENNLKEDILNLYI